MPDEDTAWIGLDLGTQGVRALAVTTDGRKLAGAVAPLESSRIGARHEQLPEDWWTGAAAVLAEVTHALAGRRIGGIAACATSGTFTLLSDDGSAAGPGIMYDDGRAGDDPTILPDILDHGRSLWAELGYRPQLSWALPKLVFGARQGNQAGRLVHQGDYVMARLAGTAVATDTGQALKSGVNLRTLRWPAELFDLLGLGGITFPDVVLPGTVIGEVGRVAAELIGIPLGTPLVSGTTDGCAAQFGAGALQPGDWNSVLGTTLVLKGVSAELALAPDTAVYSHRAPHGGYWLPGGASSTGADTVRKLFDATEIGELSDAKVSLGDIPPTYPLSGVGERFPFVAPRATGFSSVRGRATSLEQMVDEVGSAIGFAAVLLGTAYLERLCFDYLDMLNLPLTGTLTFTGGATRNGHWNQLRCDVMGVPVTMPESPEPALGSAILAASAFCGGLIAAADAMVRVERTLEPHTAIKSPLDQGYALFIEMLAGEHWIDDHLVNHAIGRSAS